MAKVKNVSGEARTVPALGGLLVLEGQVVEVPDEVIDGFVTATWAPADPVAKKAFARLAHIINGDPAPEPVEENEGDN